MKAMLILAAVSFAGCGASARLTVSDGSGVAPMLPSPATSLIPTINVVTARGWADGEQPVAADGTDVSPFARGLDHPRWLYVLPNGDVLVAETNAPPRPDDGKGIKGWFFKRYQKKAGGAVPSADRITLLRDTDGDGIADSRSVFVSGLSSPFGIALVGNVLYVANSDAIVRLPYSDGQTQITAAPVKVVDLPGGPLNHHWTKNVIATADGRKLYVSVGSNSNIAENGIDKEEGRAAIWEIDPQTGGHRVFASGLRNPVGMAWEPQSPISLRKPFLPITRSDRTPRRSDSPLRVGRRCRTDSRMECSSDSTVHGTGNQGADTKLSLCRSRAACHQESLWTC